VENEEMWLEEEEKQDFRASKWEGQWTQKFACWVPSRPYMNKSRGWCDVSFGNRRSDRSRAKWQNG
jgi:hypothetical protein